MPKFIKDDIAQDGVDRRGFLECMAWAGTGLVWSMVGGVPRSFAIGDAKAPKDLFFVQISDSHMGFDKAANADVAGTFQEAINRINALPSQPAFLLHTGDISHLSKPTEFDAVDQMIKSAKTKTGSIFYVPGEHDVLNDQGVSYRARYGKNTLGNGWYSFDHSGVHFIGLVNVMDLKPGGLGSLGSEQLEWLEKDVKGLSASTPIVVFAHVPLWALYPQWGWGTDDGAQALSYLKRFGSVTVLNGHIHQTVQKIEGNMTFHTALSTAFPQPAPGTAAGPGPVDVGADRLRSFLGLSSIRFAAHAGTLSIVDSSLAGTPVAVAGASSARGKPKTLAPVADNEIAIDNFVFNPPNRTVPAGTTVTWINRDDVPHRIASFTNAFTPGPTLDTDGKFSQKFETPGVYKYYCTVHPTMTGIITVQ
ncbi:MAG TPA: metallophosphoesterase [Gemmatimonadaceae bacterium]|nr:metallophosphoesterase [Gemmatimonadaceae bacterium]